MPINIAQGAGKVKIGPKKESMQKSPANRGFLVRFYSKASGGTDSKNARGISPAQSSKPAFSAVSPGPYSWGGSVNISFMDAARPARP